MCEHETHELLKRILALMEVEHESSRGQLREIIRLLHELVPKPKAVRAILTYRIQGETRMATTPLALVVGQPATASEVELDAQGNSEPIVGPLTFAADASGAIAVDPNTGAVTAMAPTADGAVATSQFTDAANGLVSNAFPFTVSPPAPPVAVSAVLSYTADPLPAALKAKLKK